MSAEVKEPSKHMPAKTWTAPAEYTAIGVDVGIGESVNTTPPCDVCGARATYAVAVPLPSGVHVARVIYRCTEHRPR